MKKLILTLLATVVLPLVACAEYSEQQKAFQDEKFGIFVHFGLYSMLSNGEWNLNRDNIQNSEYEHLAGGFYPGKFNADEWVKTFKDAGAKYLTITTRHHDGFSLFATKASHYNIMEASPFKRDIIKEVAEACRKYGIRLHLYYSHLDWSRTDYPLGRTGLNTGRPKDKQDYDHYFRFMNEQITELLSNYGPIGCMWFDGWWDHDSDSVPFNWRLKEQYDLVHRLQPDCLILNNHHQKPFPGEDLQGFEQDLPGENTFGLSGQEISRLPLEECLTMDGTWGYRIAGKEFKSTEWLIQNLVKCAGMNTNLLLNVGPRADGTLPEDNVERLKGIGEWLRTNGETVYGTRGGLVREWGVTTTKDNKVYVHILNSSDKGLFLPLGNVKSARMFADGKKVNFTKTGEGITLNLAEAPKGVDTIVELTLK